MLLKSAVWLNITTTPGGKTVLYSRDDYTAVVVHLPTKVSYVHMKPPKAHPDDYTVIADLEMME